MAEEVKKFITFYKLEAIFTQNLSTYPEVLVIEFNYGYGMDGGNFFGGTNGLKRRSTVEYLDRSRIQISVDKHYGTIGNITKINQKEYVITFVDSTLSLYVMFITGSESANTEVEYTPKGYGN